MKVFKFVVIAAVSTSLFLFGATSTASASTRSAPPPSVAELSVPGFYTYSAAPGEGVSVTSEGIVTAKYSEDNTTVTLTAPNGSSITVTSAEVNALADALLGQSPSGMNEIQIQGRASSFSCAMALTVVGWIHSWGWGAAAALAAAAGAVGAAIVAYVMLDGGCVCGLELARTAEYE